MLKPSRNQAAIHLQEGLDFRLASAQWNDEQKTNWVLKRLRVVLRNASANTKYYADIFQRIGFDPNLDFGFEEFARLPVLERAAMSESNSAMISQDVPQSHLQADASGGSSGAPVRIWLGPAEIGWNLSATRFFFGRLGVPLGSRIAYLWGHHLDPGHKPSFVRKLMFFARNERWFDCFRLSDDILLEYHREMEKFQPDCIVAYASALGMFADFLHKQKIQPTYPATCILTGAEKLYSTQRETAEKVFGCPVYERYGARDGGLIGYQLPPLHSKDFIVDWANVLLEPETNDAETAVLVTKLHADGMPMIRYRIGDTGIFPPGSRPGHPVFRLHAVVGRTVDRIWHPQGSYVHGNQFPHMFKDFPVREFMVVQNEDYSLEIQLVPNHTFSAHDKDAILSLVSKNLPGLPVHIRMMESISKTIAQKWRPVVTRVVR